MNMKRNRHLELRLVPPPPSPFIFSEHQQYHSQECPSYEINTMGEDLKEKQNQQLTIFYDGKVSVCDVTELQAKTIIKVAGEEIDDNWRIATGCSSPLLSPLICNQGMKRSLQRFLQTRKHRIKSTSPYHT